MPPISNVVNISPGDRFVPCEGCTRPQVKHTLYRGLCPECVEAAVVDTKALARFLQEACTLLGKSKRAQGLRDAMVEANMGAYWPDS